MLSPTACGRVGQEDRHQHDEGGAEERAEHAAQPADDDHEEHEERQVDVERQRLGAAEVEEDELGARHPAVERADREGEELGAERAHADDLGRDVAVADRHPRTAHPPAHEVLRDQREERHEGERDDVARRRGGRRAGDGDAEERARGRGDRARRGVVGEPGDLVEEPDQEELGGERGDGEVEALDAEARDAEHDADEGRDEPREQEHDRDVEPRERGAELERGVRADRHEAAGAERELPRIAGEEVQPERGQRVDEERAASSSKFTSLAPKLRMAIRPQFEEPHMEKDRIKKSDSEWKAQLSPEAFNVARKHGTERAFTSPLNAEKREGTYHCVCCGEPVFASDAKFESGTGWPSFYKPAEIKRGRRTGGPRVLHETYRSSLRQMRSPSRPCVPGRPAADRLALLHQRRGLGFRA